MTPTEFCYWLQGYFELSGTRAQPIEGLTLEQVRQVRAHLQLVFEHSIDHSYGLTLEQGQVAQEIHDGKKIDTTKIPSHLKNTSGRDPLIRC